MLILPYINKSEQLPSLMINFCHTNKKESVQTESHFVVPAPPASHGHTFFMVSLQEETKSQITFPPPLNRLCPRVLKHLSAHLQQLLLLPFLWGRVKG